ncbi:secretin N-terminal domain-containing protein [Cupriavidus pampae]|uniref:Type 3 secretion system secretin n=1 Tax=Cupriavidus pampae TaxID=659251 RepID=A0ABN7Y384_9BURK|nr:secretin N-terminal domain-containing protein [Cupriavidus pampae]CAG9167825.1 Type 3 secretion system secretin [Cupriavidus pampae]
MNRLGMVVTRVTVALLLLSSCAADMRYRELDTKLAGLPPDEALQVLAQTSAQYPDDLDIRSRYLQRRRQVMDDYLTRAVVAYEAGDAAQARNFAQRAQQAAPGDDNPTSMIEWIDRQAPLDMAVAHAEAVRAERPEEALAIVSDVLAKQPGNARAARLRNELSAPKGRDLGPQLSRDLSQPITVQFRDQPLISIFELVSNITGLNFTFDREVVATVPTTIYATNTPVRQVLTLVLQANQLASKIVSGNSLLIYPKRQDKEAEYRDLVVRTFYLQNAQAPQVLAMLKQMVKSKDLVLDERTNAIVIRDTPEAIKVAERLVAALDVMPAEVVIEAQILEVTASDLLQFGILYPEQVSFTPQPLPDSNDPTVRPPGFLTFDQLRHLNGSDILVRLGEPSITLNMLQKQGKTKTLASPRIRVRNREKAKVLIGDRLPVVTTTLSSNFSSESVNYQDVGLTLEVAPVIVGSSDVQVKMRLEVSNVTDTIRTSSGLIVYQIGTRSAETVMSVRNNQTQVLAGLLQRGEHNSGQGLPGLSRIPILDRIFGTRSNDASQTELILLLTPRVVRNQEIPASNIVVFDSGTEGRITTERDVISSDQVIRMPPPRGGGAPPPSAPPPMAPAPAPATAPGPKPAGP